MQQFKVQLDALAPLPGISPCPARPNQRARIGLVGPTSLAIEFAQAKVSVVIGNCSPITFPKMHLTRTTVDVRYVS